MWDRSYETAIGTFDPVSAPYQILCERLCALVDNAYRAYRASTPGLDAEVDATIAGVIRTELGAMPNCARGAARALANLRVEHWRHVRVASMTVGGLSDVVNSLLNRGEIDEVVKRARISAVLRDLPVYCDAAPWGSGSDHAASLRDGTEVYWDVGEDGESFLRLYDRKGDPLDPIILFGKEV